MTDERRIDGNEKGTFSAEPLIENNAVCAANTSRVGIVGMSKCCV